MNIKLNTTKYMITFATCGLALALAVAFASPSDSQSADTAKSPMMASASAERDPHAAKTQRETMMAEMKTQDAELASQISRISEAPESQRMDLVVAVLNSMVEQRAARHEQMREFMETRMDNRPMSSGMPMSKAPSNPLSSAEDHDPE